MTPDKALERIKKLLALAGSGSGATEEESRTAAAQAVRLMSEHGFGPGSVSDGAVSGISALDDLEVIMLKQRVLDLERLLGDRHTAHLKEIAARDEMWVKICDGVRRADDADSNKRVRAEVKRAKANATRKEWEHLARSGGRARARKLTPERKREIAADAARARWAKWRQERR